MGIYEYLRVFTSIEVVSDCYESTEYNEYYPTWGQTS